MGRGKLHTPNTTLGGCSNCRWRTDNTSMNATRKHAGTGRKIVDLATLSMHRAAARAAGHTVVHCHGCFDIVHPGHIRYFQFAKQQGDILVVSLTGDPHVGKGEGRPYVPQELRAENIAALEFVDWVYINPEQTAVGLLGALKPDLYIKGREYEHNQHPGFLKERATVESYGGRVIFSSGDVVYSSSHIIDSYAQRLDLEQEKLQLFCRRYEINRATLLAALDEVVDRPFVVVGDVLLDRYQYCDATDLASDGPALSLVPLERRDYLGGAAMIARHLAGLGAEPTLIASFGTDDASDSAIDTLESAGIEVIALRNRKRMALKTRFLVDTQKMFQLDEASSTPTDSANEKWLLEQVGTLSTPETGMIIYDAGLGVMTDTLSFRLREAAGSYRALVGGTAGSRGKLARVTGGDMVVASERALRLALRDFEQGLSALAYRLLKDAQGKSLLMPLGKKGLLAFDGLQGGKPDEAWEGRLRSEYLASPINGVLDRLGFDEALLAVAGGLVGSGANVHQAAYVGLAAAVYEARQLGHVPVDGHELRQFLEQRPELGS